MEGEKVAINAFKGSNTGKGGACGGFVVEN